MELLDKVLSDHNLIKVIDKVVKNGGSAGIDGMSVEEGREYFLKHKDEIINKLKTRTYKPQPVKRVETKLYLKVNRSKSKVDSYKTIKFLGFGFYYNPRHKQLRVRVHKKSIKRLKNKLRDLTSRRWSIKLEYRLFKIKQVVFGWINYFKLADMRQLMIKRFNSLKKLIKIFNLNKTIEEAWALANTRKGIMHRSKSLNNFITNKTLALKGLVSMFEYYTTRINLNVH